MKAIDAISPYGAFLEVLADPLVLKPIKVAILKFAPSGLNTCICECALNTAVGNIPSTKILKKQLLKQRQLKKLAEGGLRRHQVELLKKQFVKGNPKLVISTIQNLEKSI